MTLKNWLIFVFGSALGAAACGHPGAPPATGAPVAVLGVDGAPLPEGRYILREGKQFREILSLEFTQGKPSLASQEGDQFKALPLKALGPGPLWTLVNREPDGKEVSMDLLVADESHAWLGLADPSLALGRIEGTTPPRLRGDWTALSFTEGRLKGVQFQSVGGVLDLQEGKERFSTAWFPAPPDGALTLMVTASGRTEGEYWPLVERDGLLGVFFAERGVGLFLKKPAAPPPLTLGQLPSRLFLYSAKGRASTLKCRAGGCDQVAMDNSADRVAMKVGEPPAPFAIRLREGDSAREDRLLVRMGERVLVAGMQGDLLLTPVEAARVPPDLLGAWKTTVAIPLEDFDLAELRVAKEGTTIRRADGKSGPAYLVQSAFDDGLLLLASRPGLRRWDLWRVARTRQGWFLSSWRNVGAAALYQGTPPAWSPGPRVAQALAEFCDLERHRARIATYPEAYAEDPTVAARKFAEDAAGNARFRPIGLRAFFRSPSPSRLEETLAGYNLPSQECPALTEIMAASRKAAPEGAKAEPAPARAWLRMDRGTQKEAIGLLNQLWSGSIVYFETDEVNAQGEAVTRHRFPGSATLAFTPDCCHAKGACPAAATWAEAPWSALNFAAPELAPGLRVGYAAEGQGPTARFVAVVAVDPTCSGKPVYVWRSGTVNDSGDVMGTYQPLSGDTPPTLPPSRP